jgi:hypothetical protein
MSKYTYLRATTHATKEDALQAAFYDIENNLADPIEITDDDLKEDDLVYSDEQIGELYVQSNHEPLPPPTIRARVIDKQAKVRRVGWLARMKSKLNSALYGNPGHWS